MAQTEHRALVEVLRVGLTDDDATSTAGPPVVVLHDMMTVNIHAALVVCAAVASRSPVACIAIISSRWPAGMEKHRLRALPITRKAGPDTHGSVGGEPSGKLPTGTSAVPCFQRVSSPAVNDILSQGGKTDSKIHSFQDTVEDQLVSMTFLMLCDEQIIPQPEDLQRKGALQLLDALWSAVPHSDDMNFSSSLTYDCGPVPLPRGFLTRSLHRASHGGDFAGAMEIILRELASRAQLCSIMGDVNAIFQAWMFLLESKPLAKAVAERDAFCPPGASSMTGRTFQKESALASLVGISFLHDRGELVEARPSLRQQVYDTINTDSDADMAQVRNP
jgi:hypothetical protein